MSNQDKPVNKKKKIIITTIVFLIVLVFYWFVFSVITLLIKDNVNFNFSHIVNYFFDPVTVTLTLIVFVITLLYYVYVQVKKANKKGPGAERSDSNLYDDSKFLSNSELDKLYGIEIGKNKFSPIFLKNLSTTNVNGLVINSNFTKKGEYYFHAGNGLHNFVIGTTGTGKTKFLLIPSILMMAQAKNKPSMVVIDVKGEILTKTYHTLNTQGYDCHIVDLRNPSASEKYNPLDIIISYYDAYLKSNKVNRDFKYKYETEINKLAELIVPNEKGGDSFWSNAAQNVFKGIVYGLLEDYEDNLSKNNEKGFKRSQFTFASIYNINSLTAEEFREFFLKRNVRSEARKLVNTNVLSNYEPTGQMNRTLSSIMSTYVTAFNRFIDSACLDVTLKSDFTAERVKDIPTAIFILLPDEDTSKYPLASVIINQIYSMCIVSSQEGELKAGRDVHFLLDEFANLPKFPNIDSWLSIGRERKIFISIFIQSMSQLEEKYGKEATKTILQNCNMKIILGLGESQSVDYFKHLFGTYTITSSSATSGYRDHSDSTSSMLQKADLVQASQFMKMKAGEIYFIELKQNPGHTTIQPVFEPRFKINMLVKEYPLSERVKQKELNLDDYVYNPYDSTIVEDMIAQAEQTLIHDEVVEPTNNRPSVDLDNDEEIGF